MQAVRQWAEEVAARDVDPQCRMLAQVSHPTAFHPHILSAQLMGWPMLVAALYPPS